MNNLKSINFINKSYFQEPSYNQNSPTIFYPSGTSSLHRRQQHLIQQHPNNFVYENNQPYGNYLTTNNNSLENTLTRNSMQHRSPRMMSTFIQHQQPPQSSLIMGSYGSALDDPNEGDLV